MPFNPESKLVPERGRILILWVRRSWVTLLRSFSCDKRSWAQVLGCGAVTSLPSCFLQTRMKFWTLCILLWVIFLVLNKRSTNSSLQGKSDPQHVSVNKVLLSHVYIHSCMYCLWWLSLYNCRVEWLWRRHPKPNKLLLALYRKHFLTHTSLKPWGCIKNITD